MAKLILKFAERELQQCAVGTSPVTIGRLPDNLIVIDNPAVSGRHARVFREGNHYVVEDLKSTNGTFVNERPIARHTLLEGDVVLVGRHSIVFSVTGGEQTPIAAGIGGTMTLDTLKQKQMLSGLASGRPSQMHVVVPKTAIPSPPARAGSVRVVSGKSDRPEYTLMAVTTIIGRAETAQIRTKGWFKPKVAAAITRKSDGFAVTPMGATVLVNGQKVSTRHDLSSGDLIEVGGLTLEFHLI
jgi:predicted component of type VI protein secretion system